MKAQSVYFLGPGKTEVREVDIPNPGPDQVQVRCVANGICMFEVSLFTGAEPATFPRVVGHEGIGVVTKAGTNVHHLQEGDVVDCGNWSVLQNMDARRAHKFTAPPTDPALALSEPVGCVVNALYAYDITPGDRVLLLGAGFMGLLNLQGLAHYPLSELVVTDIKQSNVQLAREFGATDAIQSGTSEGDARLEELTASPFDLVVETSGAERAIQMAGTFTRPGGRLAIFSWHHAPRLLDIGLWHTRGLKVLNTAPGIGADRNIDNRTRAIRLLERGVFDLHKLVTHRHSVLDVQEAMELAAQRPEGYIKGVLLFSERS